MNQDVTKELIELVLARLDVIPDDALMSIGSYGQLSKDQLISEVKNQSKIGEKIIHMELEYLQLLKEGIYYDNASNN